jgi:predicted CxxxxCH...CXXCH cytochrome family protein
VYVDGRGISYTLGTCSNVYCHSAKTKASPGPVSNPIMAGGLPVLDANGNLTYDPYPVLYGRSYQDVGWGGAALGCNGCHQTIPRTSTPGVAAGTADSHSWIDEYGYDNLHAWNMGFEPISCRTCHYQTVAAAPPVPRDFMGVALYPDVPITGKNAHVNGVSDVVFDGVDPFVYNAWSGPVTYSLASTTWDAGSRTCSSVPCHLNQPQPEWGKPYRWYGTTHECDQCHHYASWPSRNDGTHPDLEGRTCIECHTDPHGNGRVEGSWRSMHGARIR